SGFIGGLHEEPGSYTPTGYRSIDGARVRAQQVERVHRMAEVDRLEVAEAGRLRHASEQVGVQAEGAQTRAAGLGERRGHAGQDRSAVHHRRHRVLLDVALVALVRLDVGDQPQAVVGERAPDALD